MALKTPFFKAFGPLLFGRAKTSVLTRLQRLQGLEDLYAVFGDLFPEKLLEPTAKGANSRQRRLPAVVTFWAFVAQVLSPKTSCREIAHRIEAWWRWGNLRSAGAVTPEAFCRARQRLSLDTLRLIAGQIAWTLERQVNRAGQLLPGRDVKIVDGTGVSMPDTPENQAVWPQPAGQKPGCGFPVLKLLGLFSLASGALLDHVTDRENVHDARLFHQLWSRLKKGDVLLADCAFCSYAAMAALLLRGIDTVVRLVRTIITARGFRTREVTIATTLLDPRLYPADAIRELYARRWNIELHFAQIKTTLEMDVLRCHKPQMIEKELQIHLIAYNLVRALMQKAAHLHDVPLERLSFKGSLDALRHSAQVIHASAQQPRKQAELINRLLQDIAADLVPHRLGRLEPRARKRRPKNYQLLTHPRREMKVTAHRQKYRAPRPKSSLS